MTTMTKKKTTTESRMWQMTVPARRVVVAMFAIALLATACGSDSSDTDNSDDVADSDVAAQDDTPTPEVTDAAPSQPEAPPETLPALSPPASLAEGLAMLGTSYEFVSEITTATGDQILVDGYRLDDALRYQVEAGSAIVEMVVVDGNTWLRQDGTSEWVESGRSTVGDPLASLSEPLEITADPANPSALRASYVAEALGIDEAGTVEVVIRIDDTSVSFTSTTGPIELVPTLRRATGLPEITSPV
jgi:hypothetical protein